MTVKKTEKGTKKKAVISTPPTFSLSFFYCLMNLPVDTSPFSKLIL